MEKTTVKDYPTDGPSWWKSLEDNLADIKSIVMNFYPIGRKSSPDVGISAKGAEAACEVVRGEIAAKGLDPATEFQEAYAAKDGPRMVSLLNAAWFGMPESMSSRDVPGFHVLCNLCSECHCVVPEDHEWPEDE